jgi:hypothetical protein
MRTCTSGWFLSTTYSTISYHKKHFISGLAEETAASPAGPCCTWTTYFATATCRKPEFLSAGSSCVSTWMSLGCKLGNFNKVKVKQMVTYTKYSFFNPGGRRGGFSTPRYGRFTPETRLVIPCTGSCTSLRTGLDGA